MLKSLLAWRPASTQPQPAPDPSEQIRETSPPPAETRARARRCPQAPQSRASRAGGNTVCAANAHLRLLDHEACLKKQFKHVMTLGGNNF